MRMVLVILLLPFTLCAQEFDLRGFIEKNYGQMADSAICRVALNSLTSELQEEAGQGMSWDWGATYRSDDGFMKIYHFAGEGCGAYCNPIYQAVIAVDLPESASPQFSDTEALDYVLDSIVTLVKGSHYLIFGTHGGRARGVEAVWGQSVVHCTIDPGFTVKWHLRSTTSNLVEMDTPLSEIAFDPARKTISYRYDWYDEMDDFKIYRVSGIWQFNGQTFEEVERMKE